MTMAEIHLAAATRLFKQTEPALTVLDAHNASFVSVTQQFNTTTSMGRLTLNMLLSFAQFEREIAGERIRDKIAASKKKGMSACVRGKLLGAQSSRTRIPFLAHPSSRL